MEMYLLKSAACLAFLLLFYKLLLERESFHGFKRFYLLAALITAGVIPLITFQTYLEATPMLQVGESWLTISEGTADNSTTWIPLLLWTIYLSGVLLFGTKFFLNLFKIINRIRRNQRVRTEEISAVLLPEDLPPHTFWSFVFLNKQKFQKGQIPKEVLEHEKAHAVQKHSADVLLIELLQVFLWLNPLIYLLKRYIKLNHEFLADRAVLNKGIQPANYQNTLLAFSSNAFDSQLVNSINYQSIKKRFTVMKTRTSKTTTALKSLLILPLVGMLLYSFSTKEVLYSESNSEVFDHISNKSSQEKKLSLFILGENEIVVNGRKINVRGFAQLVDKATEDWTKADYNLHGLEIRIADGVSENLIDRLNTEFKKTKLADFLNSDSPYIGPYKKTEKSSTNPTNGKAGDIPPPPPPPAPKVNKDGDVPLPPPPPPAPTVEKAGDMPPPPPPPPSPVEAIEGWIEEGAIFFYNGEKVTGQQALQIVKENSGKNLSVKVEEKTYSSPIGNIKVSSGKTVRLSDTKR